MSPTYYAVAHVTGAWGIRGEFKIEILTDNPQRFSPGNRLYLQGAPYEIEGRKTVSKRTVLKLRGIDTREQAEALRGASLEITEDDLPALAPETFYVHQIIGLEVVSTVGERLGVVADMFKTAGNDVYVVTRRHPGNPGARHQPGGQRDRPRGRADSGGGNTGATGRRLVVYALLRRKGMGTRIRVATVWSAAAYQKAAGSP